MHAIQVIGNLGQDATVNEVNGKYALNFSLAHSEKYKDKEGTPITKTVWYKATKWFQKAPEVVKYMKKGTKVFVSGLPSFREYTDIDGKLRFETGVKVMSIELLGSKPANDNQAQEAGNQGGETDDDLPF